MRLKILVSMMIVTLALTLSGCGGGGSSSESHTVSGVASKGLIKNGTNNVKVYALTSDGTKGALLATTSTGPSGEYSAGLGSYGGAVLVEVSGTYSDEATGQPVTISADRPLRAACDQVTGNVTVAVTPLTELAVQRAGAALTGEKIRQANAEVSAFFHLDIIGIKPVEATEAVLSGASQAQRNYTLALAAISQMATGATADAVFAVLATIQTDNDPSKTAAQFSKALDAFTVNSYNKTGVTSSTIPVELVNVGSGTAVLKLAVSGGGGNISGIELVLDLPSGVTLVADADGSVSASVLSVVGSAAGNVLTAAKYSAASGAVPGKLHLALVSSGGLADGEFIVLSCAVAPGVTPTFTSALLESGVRVVNASGTEIGAATVTLNAAP